ncbi:MAG: sensor histidine kinase [Lachnospiraceae bacterium]|nr:sensor histidine kinase [Lachnospiraceae bacterium]
MDTKSKNNRKKGLFCVFLCAVLPAVIMLAFYPFFGKRAHRNAEQEQMTETADQYENYFGTSYIYDIYQSAYVLYEDLAKKNSEGSLVEEDIFFPEVDKESLTEEEREYYREIVRNEMSNNRDSFLDFTGQADYYAVDTQTKNEESNIGENRTLIEEYLSSKNTEEELNNLYDAWICIRYRENGDVSLEGYHGLDGNLFLRKNQEYQHSSTMEERYGEPAPELKAPCNMVVFYGLSGTEEYAAWEDWYRMYRYYLNSGAVYLFYVLLAAVAVLAVWFRKRECYELNETRFFHVPLELVICGIVLVLSMTGPVIEMMVSCMEGFDSSGTAVLSGFWGAAGNLAAWSALFFLWFWEAGCLFPMLQKGILPYIREYSLCYRIVPFVKQKVFPFFTGQWKRFLHFIGDVDLTEHMEKSIWKVVLVNGAVVAILCTMWFGGIVGVVIYSVFLFFYLRRFFTGIRRQYQALLVWVRELSGGNLNAQMEGEAGIFEPLKEELGHIQTGFKHAVEEEVKSQKMKAELITNVSHDLKTPLTAIITYVNLLKEEHLTGEQRADYIRILDKKSMRLKVLIEDLFEISKATSNNVQLNISDVDIVNLIRQVRFEMEDKLSSSGLHFRWNLPKEKVILPLDSQKTYRVFENLLGNILKYAMKGSRVYIDLRRADSGSTVITMKNISATELNFDPKEITERFVRGDLSRNTEGSGLGLAIARSFVELQGGQLDIEIDGDLFKAIIVFP